MGKLFKKNVRTATVILLSVFFLACQNFYLARRMPVGNSSELKSELDSLQSDSRYFILRSGSEAWSMKKIVLNAEQQTISCVLDSVSYTHKLHFVSGRKGKMQYKKNVLEDFSVLNEVHLFVSTDTLINSGNYTLSMNKVQKIEVIEKDRKRTTNSYVIGAIGYTLGAAVIVGVIVAATKSSCPFVSAYDGKDFSLQGEIYGGSIYPQLARHDYIPLKMAPLPNGTLQVKISNELKEKQYTDIADLLIITHDRDVKVLPDETGNLYSIKEPQIPTAAHLGSKDVLSTLVKAGDNEILYMDDSSGKDAKNELTLRFPRPATAAKGKLVLTLKNSYWLDLLYGELAKGFGSYYANYMKEQRTKPAADLLKWVKAQQIPLEISTRKAGNWQKVMDLTTIGPLANREIVVPIDWPDVDESFVEIKLSAGFMFWEIDYAALDFSNDRPFAVQRLSPVSAKDETNKTVLTQLKNEDGIYLEQPEIGNIATIIYKNKIKPAANKMQTYILHAKGYYEHIRDFKNKPDLAFLNRFRQPNAFPVFGMELYKKVKAQSLQSFASDK